MIRLASSSVPDHDILVWEEADGHHWLVLIVRNGRTVGTLAWGGPERTHGAALAAGERAVPPGNQ